MQQVTESLQFGVWSQMWVIRHPSLEAQVMCAMQHNQGFWPNDEPSVWLSIILGQMEKTLRKTEVMIMISGIKDYPGQS